MCFALSSGHHNLDRGSGGAHQESHGSHFRADTYRHAVRHQQHQEVEAGLRHQGTMGESTHGMGLHVSLQTYTWLSKSSLKKLYQNLLYSRFSSTFVAVWKIPTW